MNTQRKKMLLKADARNEDTRTSLAAWKRSVEGFTQCKKRSLGCGSLTEY